MMEKPASSKRPAVLPTRFRVKSKQVRSVLLLVTLVVTRWAKKRRGALDESKLCYCKYFFSDISFSTYFFSDISN